MKKNYFLILAFACITVFSTAQSVTITHINGDTKADFIAANSNLVEGETYTITVNYTNLDHAEPTVRVRVLDGFSTIPGAGETSVAVTTSTTEQTVVLDLIIPDVTSDIAEARIQAVGKGADGNVDNYATIFTINDLISTDLNSVDATIGSVYASGNTLYINDATVNTYEIYNLSGSVVDAGSIDGTSTQVPLSLSKGVYIVKVGNETTKIAL